MKTCDYVMNFLEGMGVRHIFLVPGGAAMHLNDALARSPVITPIPNLHEQGCAVAAEAYARVSNDLAVAMVTAGPGGTNAITGLAGAWLDSTPVLFLSGQVKRADLRNDSRLRQRGVQELDIVSLVRPVTKYAVTILDPHSTRYHLEKACHLALTGRRGPVWLDLPLDLQAVEIEPENCASFQVAATIPPDSSADCRDAVRRAIEILRFSQRPVVLLGNGLRAASTQRLLERWLKIHPIPILTTWLGLDLVPHDDPLLFGRPGGIAPRGANFALQNCDCLISIGARLDPMITGYAHDQFARAAYKIVVDIDSAEIGKLGFDVDVPIIADAGAFLDEWLRQGGTLSGLSWEPWLSRCRQWKKRYPLRVAQQEDQPDLSMYEFAQALSDALPEGELIVPGSSGFACEIFFLMLEVKRGQRVFHNRGTGAMGFAVPAALGAAVASGKRVVSVEGDGGFQMNTQELAVIAGRQLPVKFFVVNNGGYASIRSSQLNHFQGRHIACDSASGLYLASIGKLAAAYGLPFHQINAESDLASTIQQVLDAEGPIICEVVVRPDEPRIPRLSSSVRSDGSMVSRPLEDLYPFLDREEFMENMMVPPLPESVGN